MDEKSIYFKPHGPGEIDIDTNEEIPPIAVLASHINEAGKIKIVDAVPADDEGDIGDVVIVL